MSDLPYSALLLRRLNAVGPICTHREHRVLMAFATFVRADDIAWPSVKKIAEEARLPARHVSVALKSLSEPNGKRPALLQTIKAGGGKGLSAHRRLALPPAETLTDLVRDTDAETLTESVGVKPLETLTDLARNSHRFGTDTLTKSVRGRGKEEDKEDTRRTKPPIAEFTKYFTDAFKRCRGFKYSHRGAIDAQAVKRILEAVDNDLPTARRLVDRYLADRDPFVAKNGFTLSFMSTRLNALRMTSKAAATGDAEIDSINDLIARTL